MVVAAALLRLLFLPGLGTNVPYITFYPAVAIAALYGGLRAGFLTLALSAAAAIYFWIEPMHTLTSRNPFDWLLLGTFLTTTALISVVAEAMHRARARAQKAIKSGIAAQAQREADERLRFALAQSHAGGWELDLADHTMLRTLQHDRIFGYESHVPEWTYETFLEHVLPEDRAEVDGRFRAATTTQSDWSFECRIRRNDGAVRWIWATGGHQGDATRQARRMAGIVQDITERQQAEERFRITLQMANDIVRSIPSGLLTFHCVEPDKLFLLSGNPEAERLTGLRIADWIGREYNEAWPKAAARGLTNAYLEVMRTGQDFETEDWYYQDARLEGSFRIRAFRLPNERLAVSFESITDRKRAEASLRESEERLRLALDAAHMGTFDWDVPGNRITWSRWHEELWGFQPGEFGGTYEAFSERIHPDDLPAINAEITRCLAARAPFDREFRVVWPDGSVHWIAAGGEFSFDATGQPLRMRGAVLETTARKRAEDALRQSGEQLRALSARLETLREEERTRISREIHDELGQRLTALKMDLRWIEHRLDDFGEDRRLNPILDKLVGTAELTDASVRTVQRIAAELRPGILDKLGLGTALQYEAAQFQQRSGIPCRVEAPATEPPLPPKVATAFFRIFQEALTNVARHAHATAVEVQFCPEADACRLEIGDDGLGITGMNLAKSNSLGLLGMQERARLLGGEVRFTPRPGGGTIVAVRIPSGMDEG